MAKTLVHQTLGGPGTPQEIKDIRKSSFDLHEELGYPVVFKHRWNILDEREGRATKCPYHDELYEQSPRNCEYCFGTGYVGGFADGQVVYVTLQDAPTDIIKLTPQGLLQMDQHPQMTAPWLPEMGDGDMVILADFNPRNWDIQDVHERYTLRQVNPITMRGPGWNRMSSTTSKRLRVSQESAADKLPYGHEFYEIPIIFNYDDVPPDPTAPDDPNPPIDGTYSAHDVSVRIRGAEQTAFPSSTTRDVRVAVIGNNTSTSSDIRIKGKGAGTIIDF